jgi:thiamine-monophosphate kinase
MGKTQNPGELEILRTIRAMATRRPNKAVRIGIGDDCAVLTPRPGEELVVTTDFSIEGRHFRRAWHPPEAIGHKCLARGLSDIAAMGARPIAAFVSLAIPRDLTQPPRVPHVSHLRRASKSESWITRFYTGLLALAEREHVTLAGGDLSESPSLAFADIIVIGAAPKGRALLRSTARAGDIVYVTGTLGAAAAELARLEAASKPASLGHTLPQRWVPHPGEARVGERDADQASHPHFYPQPRLAAGHALLRRRLATACIDISDGLSTDLLHLCEESKLSAEIDAAAIPVDAAATLQQALHGGDDYELLFTASPRARVPRQLGGVAIHPIGRLLARKPRGPLMTLTAQSGSRTKRSPLTPQGWQHF